jgi:antitoxin component YwqK of YwqJK toxin-antitoxin module
VSELVPYAAGKRNGCVKRFDDKSGHLVFEFCVRDDEPQGLNKSFDAATGRLTRIQWVNPRGVKGETTSIQFNGQGQPTSLQCGPQRLIGADDLWCGRGGKQGEVTLYSSEGWPSEKTGYLDGKRHGWSRRYHKDGHLLSEERYEKGKSVEERQVTDGAAKYERTRVGDDEKETVSFEESKKPRLVIERQKGAVVKELAYYANGKLEYEKLAKGRGYDVRAYDDDGSLSYEGVFVPRWGDALGLWSLEPTGLVKRYDKGQLRAEERYDEAGTPDGLQRYFERERPKQLQRREQWEKGRMRWSEDTAPSGEVLHREYAEDGSVQGEVLMKPAQQL